MVLGIIDGKLEISGVLTTHFICPGSAGNVLFFCYHMSKGKGTCMVEHGYRMCSARSKDKDGFVGLYIYSRLYHWFRD